ncbi:hypothetical protein LPH50_07405 [Xylella taiwanensis]|uniref:Uncharacterized protein n=1 Tax=Xylella taiwanensis TaxID=1444770 RepID=Z9JLD7_9GAMM|nr:hypothetical protein [Xylella taiwanensis]EWS78626.1 hypothetical protein AF72_04585 [Xylella taiwanensis]MCD8455783.1 hypothetical protein [Xylella taiwanensis]MCD8458188.1 hypothetical protein [Xylella taiwanensis]MCD8460324.1 hypothetical protein [Xylella taiwanensis]MCD8463618.1 hypothetical protein [Xylella taiwanensis]
MFTGNDLFDNLAASCEVRAVDQEAVDIEANRYLALLTILEASSECQ